MPNPLTLIDTVTPGALAGFGTEDAFAGYVGGRWADLPVIERDYPHHYFVSIAIAANEKAEFADFEQGDFQSVPELITWLKEMHGEGVWRPGTYASGSVLEKILPEILRVIPRNNLRVWGALWDGNRNIPAGWDAKQYTSGPNAETGGRNIDLTVVREGFWPIHAQPAKRHIPHTVPRVWKSPVKATVTFDPANGHWDAKGV